MNETFFTVIYGFFVSPFIFLFFYALDKIINSDKPKIRFWILATSIPFIDIFILKMLSLILDVKVDWSKLI